jgi:exo-beta-1,3-glucanase (GH17 family)
MSQAKPSLQCQSFLGTRNHKPTLESIQEEAMKYLIQTCAVALIGLSSNSYAAVSGINYDSAHDPDWVVAQDHKNVAKMEAIFIKDLYQIKAMGFNTIKTFYSTYCTENGCIQPVAKLAQAAGLSVMLGVYEFPAYRPPSWTEAQVSAAINQANNPQYGQAIIGIVVGSEDMFDHNGKPDDSMQKRIVQDIRQIRGSSVSVPVTTAQRQPDWDRLNRSDPNHVLETIQYIGANIYPYWGGSPEKVGGKSVASDIQATASSLLNALRSKHNNIASIIITEEGWPSCNGHHQVPPHQQLTSINDEIDYFATWSNRQNPAFDSYYFMAYDLETTPCTDADKHFGLCTRTGHTKDARLKICP